MSGQNHIVQKLTVEVGLSSQEEAYGLQCRISDSHDQLVLEVLSELFDRLVGENEVVQIEKIEIDLGHIMPQHLTYEFPEKLKKEAEEIFTSLLHDLHQSPGDDREVRVSTSSGEIITVRANLQPKSVSLTDALAHFLEYGVLPWGNDKAGRSTLRELVSEAMEKHPEQLRLLLQQLGNKSYVFKRLALQLPEEQLQYLAAVSGCGFSPKLPAIFKALRIVTEKFLKLAPGSSLVAENPELFIRRESLRYFAASHSASAGVTEAVFTGEIAGKIIAQYGLLISPAAIHSVKKELKNTSELLTLEVFAKTIKEEPGTEKNKRSSRDKKDESNEREQQDRQKNSLHDDKSEAGEKIKGKKEKNNSAPESRAELLAHLKDQLDENHPLAPEADSGLYIENAGMIILAPYLPAFFRNRGLVVQKDFVDEAAKWKAVHLLQWLVYGDQEEEEEIREFTEHDLILNKLLCGMDIAEPVPDYAVPGEEEKKAGIEFLKAVIENWEVIKRSSVFALRSTFLVKEGRLKNSGNDWDLFIRRDSAVDMLIDRLPWTISMIKMPWNKGIIYVEW